MSRLLATTLAFSLVAGAAMAGEFPTFERQSFPVSQHQVAVLGGAGVAEQAPAATLVRNDMPASPVQLAVLKHHRRAASLETTTTVGVARN